jgi:hypothetical protein
MLLEGSCTKRDSDRQRRSECQERSTYFPSVHANADARATCAAATAERRVADDRNQLVPLEDPTTAITARAAAKRGSQASRCDDASEGAYCGTQQNGEHGDDHQHCGKSSELSAAMSRERRCRTNRRGRQPLASALRVALTGTTDARKPASKRWRSW